MRSRYHAAGADGDVWEAGGVLDGDVHGMRSAAKTQVATRLQAVFMNAGPGRRDKSVRREMSKDRDEQ